MIRRGAFGKAASAASGERPSETVHSPMTRASSRPVLGRRSSKRVKFSTAPAADSGDDTRWYRPDLKINASMAMKHSAAPSRFHGGRSSSPGMGHDLPDGATGRHA